MYGNHIKGDNDSVALACAMDPKCKAFRYSARYRLGYLCSGSDAEYVYDDDWELCEIDRGMMISII